ncbi:MAG TPA: YeeE/YedE thiosulfate transporter family protein, partial [Azospirillum sp.]
GYVGRDEFDPTPVMSFTFIAPIGDTTQYLMTFTGASINFGIATVFGVIVGSFLMAKATGTFRLEGFVGVLALGCTIGQGISSVSMLALGSFLALGAIIVDASYGLKYMEEGSHFGVLRACCCVDEFLTF